LLLRRRARFEATSIAMRLKLLSGGSDYCAVRLDGGRPEAVHVSAASDASLPLFDNLAPGPHEVRN